MQRRGIRETLAVDVAPAMLEAVQQSFPSQNVTAGNEPQVRTWLGDVQSIPAYQVRSVVQFFHPSPRRLHQGNCQAA